MNSEKQFTNLQMTLREVNRVGEVKKNVPKLRFKGYEDAWEQRKLGELCERVVRKNKNCESDLPLTIASQFGLIDQRDFFGKIVAAKDMSNYYLLKKGEFAYNKSYSKGFDFGSIKRLNNYELGCLSTLYICFKIASDRVESDYLEVYFDTLNWYKDVMSICAEGARNHGLLNVDTKAFFEEVNVDIPRDILEQKNIASSLEKVEKLITLHQRKYDALKSMKKTLLSKMFPKNGEDVPEIRFKGFTDAWEQRKVSEIFRVTRGDVLAATQTEAVKTKENPYPVYSSQTRDKGLMGYYKDYLYEDAITWTTDGANAGTVNYRTGKFYCTNVCGVLLPKEVQTNQMIAEALNNVAKGYVSHVGNPKLMNNVMADITIRIPIQSEEREKMSSFFANFDNLITLHQRKLEELKNMKKTLLQQMFV